MQASIEQIKEMSTDVRGLLERVLTDSLGTDETANTCLYASFLLNGILDKFSGARTKIRGGGSPELQEGFLDARGKWRGHYWIEGTTAMGQDFLVDITADQFGEDKVIALPLEVARERYRPGDQDDVDDAVSDLSKRIECEGKRLRK